MSEHGKGCWYFVYIDECVLCGRGSEVRERRQAPKPIDPVKRSEFRQYACQEHFL